MAGTAPCRACDGPTSLVLDLGDQPQAGLFPEPTAAAAVPLFRLSLALCARCHLVQLDGDGPGEVEDPAAPPPTSSATVGAHARAMVGELVAQGLATRNRRVLELASHRGYLRPFLAEAGIETTVLAPEPEEAGRLAADGARVLERHGFAAVGYADPRPRDANGEPFDLIVDHYLLSHLDRPRAALATLSALLGPDGAFVLETDHLLSIVEGCQFDAIRHGHRSYLSLSWLSRELESVGLRVVDARIEPVYGGALRVWARRPGRGHVVDPGGRVRTIMEGEEATGIASADGLARFATNVDRVRSAARTYLEHQRSAGRRVVGYGAPARAVTFLNAAGIGAGLLTVTADRAASKHGRVIPGVQLPIVTPDDLRARQPDEVLVLAWDLADEIRASMPWLEDEGGRWLVALPELAIVGPGGRFPIAV
jgi:SAM-dependent methyltransferase